MTSEGKSQKQPPVNFSNLKGGCGESDGVGDPLESRGGCHREPPARHRDPQRWPAEQARPGGGRPGEELSQLPGLARQGRKLHAPTWLSEVASQHRPATRPGNGQPARRDSPSRAPPVGSARGARAAAASGLERGTGPPPTTPAAQDARLTCVGSCGKRW